MAGFVSFVSSGPGDPELLTLKAVDRLERADAVLFDDLSSGSIFLSSDLVSASFGKSFFALLIVSFNKLQ